MTSLHCLRHVLVLSVLMAATAGHTEDIDIYSGNAASTGVPNVLLVLDNAANFSASAANCTYVDGSAPSLNGTAGGIEQCAIYNVVSSLPAGAINLGLMVYNATGIRDVNNANCGSANGGCLVQPIVPMSGDAKTSFLNWVKTWQTSNGGAGSFWIKASGEATAAAMQEAWAYYAGGTGLSGRSYAGIQPPSGCQKNFVIFVGNAFDTSGTPGDTGVADPIAALAAAPGVTAAQKLTMSIPSGTYGTDAFSCKKSYAMGNSHNTKNAGLYADEWARYMYQTDVYGNLDGSQGITTYTVGLLGSACVPDYPALLTSMAYAGGGKYFATSSYDQISTAILKILNEIQAVNSVFSSASLPASVNAQGTYLNQIFMGLFRPDASANPRWLGNLKQYQFIYDTSGQLVLGDALGNAALSSSGTGFISPNAVSFWTSKKTSVAPDSTGGYYRNDPRVSNGDTYDSPDGELVERGGVGQQIRLENLTASFGVAPGSTNPRRLYTYCPSGTCNADLTHSVNAFAVTNSAITDAMLNSVATASVSSLAAAKVSGTVVATATTRTSSGFASGDSITISGASPSSYNGTYTITALSATSFSYTLTALTSAPSSATGTIVAQKAGQSSRADLIRWIRGEDNFGDEKSPGSPYTVRPSVHGDVLHSRPLVINYGDSRGLVVFYGGNDGVFRAINGSQTEAIGAVPAGGELWGLVLPEHFARLDRQRINSPEVKLSTTVLSSAQTKDYFVDGSTGVFQQLKADGTIDKAYIYLVMRRGGRFVYAIDVSNPTAPRFMWRVSSASAGFAELGQSWSRPRVTLVKGYADADGKPKPVLVFGAGYDAAEDTEPPGADTMGRGLFVLDAVTGALVWSAGYGTTSACSGNSTQAACTVQGMNWSIPADISFVDRDNDGLTDRLYAADTGGNVWRVDLEPSAGSTPDKWRVSKLAALGCASGVCASGVAPRKFFFPPNVVFVGATGSASSYDAVLLGSGDREHPLQSSTSGSAYLVPNRFYMIKDVKTGKDAGSVDPITEMSGSTQTLFDATSLPYDGSLSGFYMALATGEKVVNASITVKGTTFFGTNKPTPPSTNSCLSNLGEARGYAVNPFTGTRSSTIYDGGGLPPTPVSGVVTIAISTTRSVEQEFCVGCGGLQGASGGDARSALGAADLSNRVPKKPRRTYWYKR